MEGGDETHPLPHQVSFRRSSSCYDHLLDLIHDWLHWFCSWGVPTAEASLIPPKTRSKRQSYTVGPTVQPDTFGLFPLKIWLQYTQNPKLVSKLPECRQCAKVRKW